MWEAQLCLEEDGLLGLGLGLPGEAFQSRRKGLGREPGRRKAVSRLFVSCQYLAPALTFLLPTHHVLASLAPGSHLVALSPVDAEVDPAWLCARGHLTPLGSASLPAGYPIVSQALQL